MKRKVILAVFATSSVELGQRKFTKHRDTEQTSRTSNFSSVSFTHLVCTLVDHGFEEASLRSLLKRLSLINL